MIPFTPEPIDQLKARYPAAIARLFDGSRVAAGAEESPAQIRTHVFDYDEDELGIRLIISRERDPEHGIVIHFSASFQEKSKLVKSARAGGLAVSDLKEIAVLVFQKISGDYRGPKFIDFSPVAGIPNWVIHDQAEPQVYD
jgi:hypothetical protein